MRIASYNILSGGFSAYDYALTHPERLSLLKQAISLLNADFVGLIDTFRWDEIFTNEQIADMFGYRSAYCINLNDDRLRKKGHNNGITVLSNVDVESFETVSLTTRDAVRAKLISEGRNIDIFTVYLDDLSEDTRLQQVTELVTQVDLSTPAVLMGDLNALKREDLPYLQPFINRFFRDNPGLATGYKSVLQEMMRGEALDEVEKNGFVDAADTVQATAPTKLFPADIHEPLLRLDYAFYRGDIKITHFAVPRDELFDRASDHYPIVFDCQFT